jgi:hypothetical protein
MKVQTKKKGKEREKKRYSIFKSGFFKKETGKKLYIDN